MAEEHHDDELIRELVENVPAALYVEAYSDEQPMKTIPLYMSPQVEGLTGYTPSEWIADSELWMKTIHPDDQQRVVTDTWRTTLEGRLFDVEYRFIHRDGRVLRVHEIAVTRRDAEQRRDVWYGAMLVLDAGAGPEGERPPAE